MHAVWRLSPGTVGQFGRGTRLGVTRLHRMYESWPRIDDAFAFLDNVSPRTCCVCYAQSMRAADPASTMEDGDEPPTDATAEPGESSTAVVKKGSLTEEVDVAAAARTKEAENAQEAGNKFDAFLKRYDDRVAEVRNDRWIRHNAVMEEFFTFTQRRGYAVLLQTSVACLFSVQYQVRCYPSLIIRPPLRFISTGSREVASATHRPHRRRVCPLRNAQMREGK